MRTALFYDTETSGLPLFNDPSEDPRQPHIVQLGAILVDLDTRTELGTIDVIVRPDGWVIPDEVAAIHGLTTERAMDVGIPESDAVDMFHDLWAQQLRIGHNESFDARILRIALKRFRDPMFPNEKVAPSDAWKAARAECTQRMATPILKLPPTPKMRAAGRFHHKSANLGEAYAFFMGKPLENAHSAMADARACMDVYFACTSRSTSPVAA